jgi:hypothetical protein
MKWVHLFIFIFLTQFLHSQTAENGKVVALHPSIGNTIDIKEKKQFSLFPEYTDSLFESAQLIKYNDTTYTFLIKTTSGKSFERAAKFHEMQKDYATIESIKPAQVVNSEKKTDYYSPKEENNEKAKSRRVASGIGFEIFFDVLLFSLQLLQHVH